MFESPKIFFKANSLNLKNYLSIAPFGAQKNREKHNILI